MKSFSLHKDETIRLDVTCGHVYEIAGTWIARDGLDYRCIGTFETREAACNALIKLALIRKLSDMEHNG